LTVSLKVTIDDTGNFLKDNNSTVPVSQVHKDTIDIRAILISIKFKAEVILEPWQQKMYFSGKGGNIMVGLVSFHSKGKRQSQKQQTGNGMNYHTRCWSDPNHGDFMMKLLYTLMLLFSLDHVLQRVGLVHVASLVTSPFSAMVLKNNEYRLRHSSCTTTHSFNGSRRGCGSLVTQLHYFRRAQQLGMVAKDDATSTVTDVQETKAIENSDDDLGENFAANHFFDSAIINHKLQGLNLSDQKLLVLQDAAKRMVQKHEAQMKEAQQHHSSKIATSIEQSNTQHQKEIKKLTATMERRLQQMEFERKKVIDELKTMKQEYTTMLETERKANNVKMEEAYAKYKVDRAYWIEAERQLRDELELVEVDAKFSLGNATATIQRLDVNLRQQREKYQSLKEKYDNQQERYQQATVEMERMRNGKQNLETELEIERENVMKLKQQFNEQMEIAESSVATATSRENILQIKYDSLQQANNHLREEVSRLKQELDQRDEAYQELNSQFLAVTTKSDSPILSNALQRVRKNIWSNDQSLLRLSFRWINSVFVPRILPFHLFSMGRTKKKHLDARK
jgi:hypothetical protein